MAKENFQNSKLWKSTLEYKNDEFEAQREILRVTYIKFRNNTEQLLSRITSSLPELTIHSINHIDELWDISSLIIGPDYEINPLEAFILGSAFLIHDSALCYEAFENGLDGLRE